MKKYDQKIVLLMFLQMYFYWIMWVHLLVIKVIKMNMMFLVNMLMMNMQFLLLWKMSCNYFVACVWTLKNVKNPFTWWASHETQLSNVSFLACYVFRIIKFQLETKRIFSIVDVITSFHWFRLGSENLVHFVITLANNVTKGCLGSKKFFLFNFSIHEEKFD